MNCAAIVAPRGRRVSAEGLAYGGLALTSVAWALAFIAGKIVLAEMTPLAVAAWRFVVAALVLTPFALRRWPGAGSGQATRPLAIMVICGGIVYPCLFLGGLARTTATNTALLVAVNPALTVLLSPLIGERLSRPRVVGALVALAGAATVITKGDLHAVLSLSLNPGDLLALGAAFCWAGFNLASRGVVANLTPAFTNWVVYGVGGLALAALAWTEHPFAQIAAASPAALGSLLLMAVVASVAAGQLFLVAVRTLGVSRTVLFIYFVPVLTALLSTLLLGEHFELAQGAGGAAVLAGVYWATRGGSSHA